MFKLTHLPLSSSNFLFGRVACVVACFTLPTSGLCSEVTQGFNRIITRAGTDTVLTVPFASDKPDGSWTLDARRGALFPRGAGLRASSSLENPTGDLLFFPAGIDNGWTVVGASGGLELRLTDPWFYYDGSDVGTPAAPAGFYRVGEPEAGPGDDLLVTAGTLMVLRNVGPEDGLVVFGGRIPSVGQSVPLGAGQAGLTEDCLVVNPYPVSLSLDETGLAGSAGFQSSTSLTAPDGDYLLLYERLGADSGPRVGRAADAVYFHYTGGETQAPLAAQASGWYDLNNLLNGPLDATLKRIAPSSGYLVRKRSGASGAALVSASIPYDATQTPLEFGVYVEELFWDRFTQRTGRTTPYDDNAWLDPEITAAMINQKYERDENGADLLDENGQKVRTAYHHHWNRNFTMEGTVLAETGLVVHIFEPLIADPLNPSGDPEGRKPPALFVFHGRGGSPSTLRAEGISQCPEARVFAVQGPFPNWQGTSGFQWRPAPGAHDWNNHTTPGGFYEKSIIPMRTLVENIENIGEPDDPDKWDPDKLLKYGCDPDRVFFMGFSAGAHISWQFVREYGHLLAGLVTIGMPVTASFEDPNATLSAFPLDGLWTLPTLEVFGTRDTVATDDARDNSVRRATEVLGMRNYFRASVEQGSHEKRAMWNLRRAFFRQLVLGTPRERVFGHIGLPWLAENAVPGDPVDPVDPVDPIENPEFVLEFENQTLVASASEVLTVTDPAASGGAYLRIVSPEATTESDFECLVEESGAYRIEIGYKAGPDAGALSFWVEGVRVGTYFDTYAATESFKSILLSGTIQIEAGSTNFTFRCVGANAASTGSNLSIDYVKLIAQ